MASSDENFEPKVVLIAEEEENSLQQERKVSFKDSSCE